MELTSYWKWACTPYLRAKLPSGERGASIVEYALLVSFIAIVCIAAVMTLGNRTKVPLSSLGSAI